MVLDNTPTNPYTDRQVRIRENFNVKKEHEVRSWEIITSTSEVRSAINRWYYEREKN